MRKKRSPIKDLLFLSISSFILVAAWVGFNIYHTWVTTTITPELQLSITPINPSFDRATINSLKTRTQVVPAEKLSATTTSPTPRPTGAVSRPVIENVSTSQPELSQPAQPTETLLPGIQGL